MAISVDYPRPQMQRESWSSLDGAWLFLEDMENQGLSNPGFLDPDAWSRAEIIQIPFPPECAASGIGRIVPSVIWYQRKLPPLEIADTDRVIVYFEAIDFEAQVWCNSRIVGTHTGGQTRFSVDITDVIRPKEDNWLTVRCLDRPHDLEQPRGKQDWRDTPHDIWYKRTSGIWRSVWYEVVPVHRIVALALRTPSLHEVWIEADVNIPPQGGELHVSLSHQGEVLARQAQVLSTRRARLNVDLSDHLCLPDSQRLLWTPENPVLFEVEARLQIAGQCVDRVESYVGMRTIATHGGSILLNDQPYFLRLVLDQGYWPHTHLSSPSTEALIQEVEVIKALGFNGVRTHQRAADPRFLALCDKVGLVVWADSAAAYAFTETAIQRKVNEWFDIIQRDRSHPSIAAWVAFNESWGLPELEHKEEQRSALIGVASLIKALDPDRLMLGNDGWEYLVGDVIGVHHYSSDSGHLEELFGMRARAVETISRDRIGSHRIALAAKDDIATRPIVLSEFGGISCHHATDSWSGYAEVTSATELTQKLMDLVKAARSPGLAGYCYTQLADTEQEQNGLLTADRVPKAPIEQYAAIFSATQT